MAKTNTLLMSVDLGTTFIKVGVYTLDSRCIASAGSKVNSETPAPGIFIQKGDNIFNAVVESMKSISEKLGNQVHDVSAIAFTGQMSGFMGVDKDWNDITTWSCSLDNRYMPYADRQIADLKEDFWTICGTNAPQMAPKYEWFKTEFPDQSKKIAKFVMISSYVVGRLGDVPIEKASIDRSYTQWTGLADVKNGIWSSKLCEAVKMDAEHLPDIVNSNHICGTLSRAIADITGFKAGIPLVSGAGDKIAGCLGSGVVNNGDLILEASSYGALSCCTDEFKTEMKTRRVDIVPSAIPGQFFAMNFIAGSGITLDWYLKTFYEDDKRSVSSIFQEVDSKVNAIKPGCDGLMAIGLLGGSCMPLDGALRGMWMGFNWSHKKEHFYRALLESYSYDFALTAKCMEEVYPDYRMDKVKVIGGGAKSDVWTQINSDVIGKTFQSLDRDDVALWGAAIIAGNAIGAFDDMKTTALKHANVKKEYYPDNNMTQKYSPYVSLYEKYTVELHPFYKQIQDCSAISSGKEE
ncbi:MAG: FGGY family carbohydrate kinase [Eubacteriales bacterium]